MSNYLTTKLINLFIADWGENSQTDAIFKIIGEPAVCVFNRKKKKSKNTTLELDGVKVEKRMKEILTFLEHSITSTAHFSQRIKMAIQNLKTFLILVEQGIWSYFQKRLMIQQTFIHMIFRLNQQSLDLDLNWLMTCMWNATTLTKKQNQKKI